MGIHTLQVPVRGFDQNLSYVLFDEASGNAVIVDPSGDIDKVFSEIDARGLSVVAILVTHTHFDHVEKLRSAIDRFYVPIIVHESSAEKFKKDGEVKAVRDGDVFMLGENRIHIMHTPGHIDDALCFYIEAENTADGIPALIAGDTIFVEGCGRTNEEGVRDLYESLQRIKQLPDKTLIYPGHDYGSTPHSSLLHERSSNKYLRAEDLEEFKTLRLGA